MTRPADDDTVAIADSLRWQAGYCAERGSPVAAAILAAVLDDLAADGALAGLLPATVRFGDLPGLRIMAAVHQLAIDRSAPAVALHLPTLGGTPPADDAEFRRAVVSALLDNADVLADSLARTPQTNETGRAALLRAALSRVAGPVRLREIGASAGLNLRADHLPGDPALEAGPLPDVIDRIGCDLAPIDPSTQEGRTRLTSYVWVDDLDRYERLRNAISVAQRIPATVVQMDAARFAESLDLADGTTTMLWHSAMWVYLDAETRGAIDRAVDALGAQATPERRLAHASWEWRADGGESSAPFELVLRRWDGSADDARVIAVGVSHGWPAVAVG